MPRIEYGKVKILLDSHVRYSRCTEEMIIQPDVMVMHVGAMSPDFHDSLLESTQKKYMKSHIEITLPSKDHVDMLTYALGLVWTGSSYRTKKDICMRSDSRGRVAEYKKDSSGNEWLVFSQTDIINANTEIHFVTDALKDSDMGLNGFSKQ